MDKFIRSFPLLCRTPYIVHGTTSRTAVDDDNDDEEKKSGELPKAKFSWA